MKLAIALAICLAASASNASAQEFNAPAPQAHIGTQFYCEDGSSLAMRFGSQNQSPIAAVSAGSNRHVLPLQPWDGRTSQIVWSDGAHKVTWDPGVRITWIDGETSRACGRRVHQRSR